MIVASNIGYTYHLIKLIPFGWTYPQVLDGVGGALILAISGLVLTLVEDVAAADRAMTALSRDPRVTVGERYGRRIALVAETPDAASDQSLFDELRMMPGIEHVDVTFVGLDDTDTESGSCSLGKEDRNHGHR